MTTKVLLAMIVIAMVGVVIMFRLLSARSSADNRQPGFREIVKNPELWEEMISSQQGATAAIRDAQAWNASQVQRAVHQYVFDATSSQDSWQQREILKSLAPRTHPFLLEILGDEGNRQILSRLEDEGLTRQAPVTRICELFDGTMPREAVELLRPFLRDESDDIRKECILAVAESGTAAALPDIQKSLTDTDEFVRSYTLIGIRRAVESGRIADQVSYGVLSDLERLVLADQNVEDAAKLLADLDSERAEAFLTSPEVLNPHRRYMHEVLRVIRLHNFKIDRERVLAFIAEYRNRAMEYPNDYTLGELLALLGRFKNEEDQHILEDDCDSPNDRVCEGAANGLLAMHGLEQFDRNIWEREEAAGWDSLTHEQQMHQAVFWLDTEVNNGGHSQYFFNSAGANWKLALDGLKAMGFKERARIFEKALSFFGEDGPAEDRDVRQQQLALVFRDHEHDFDKLDQDYYKANENVEVYSRRFVIKNSFQFR